MNKKINILFLLPNFDTGGSEKLVFDMISSLDKSKFSPVLCVFFTGTYEQDFLKLGVPFYVIHKNGIQSKWSVVRFLNGIIRRHHIDVVNTHHTSPLIQGVLPFKVFNKVWWAHTEHTRLNLDPNATPKIKFLARICLKFVNKFIGISQDVCDYFQREAGIPPKKVVKILNGINLGKFKFLDDERRDIRARYRKDLDISDNTIVIGVFANFRKQKNHECLLRAADVLVKKGINNFHIVLAGNGPELDNIKKLAGDWKLETRVTFLGSRMDIPEL